MGRNSEATLAPWSEGIWTVDDHIRLMPGVVFPARSIVFRLATGGLLVHSPVDFGDRLVQQLGELGPVEVLFAPNLGHNSFALKAQRQFPEARLFAPPGFERKVPDARIAAIVEDELPPELASDFDSVFVHGAPKMNEVILRHRASRSLVVADYFFNIHEYQGWLMGPLLKMVGAHRRATQSKLWRKITADRQAMQASAERVLALDFGQILLSHGRIIEDGRAVAQSGLGWLTEELRAPSDQLNAP
jgi:hypothetical protein